jgi:quercetin dioxygenase-like cupin family protein
VKAAERIIPHSSGHAQRAEHWEETMTSKSVLLSILLLGAGALAVVAQEPPKIKSTPVVKGTTTMSDEPLVFPSEKPETTVSIVEIAPGAATARHKHPFIRYTYVTEGSLTVEMEGGKSHNYPAGSFIIEAMDHWHLGKNTGATPTKLLVIDHQVQGRSNVVTQ